MWRARRLRSRRCRLLQAPRRAARSWCRSPVWLSFEVFAAVSLPFFVVSVGLGQVDRLLRRGGWLFKGGLVCVFATSFVGSCRPDPGVVSGLSGGVVLSGGFVSSGRRRFGIQREASCFRGSTAMQAELEPRCLRPASGFLGIGLSGAVVRGRGGFVRSARRVPFGALPAGSPRVAGRSRAVSSRPKAQSPLPSREGVPDRGTAGESAAGGSSSTGGTVGFSGSRLRHSSFSCFVPVRPAFVVLRLAVVELGHVRYHVIAQRGDELFVGHVVRQPGAGVVVAVVICSVHVAVGPTAHEFVPSRRAEQVRQAPAKAFDAVGAIRDVDAAACEVRFSGDVVVCRMRRCPAGPRTPRGRRRMPHARIRSIAGRCRSADPRSRRTGLPKCSRWEPRRTSGT